MNAPYADGGWSVITNLSAVRATRKVTLPVIINMRVSFFPFFLSSLLQEASSFKGHPPPESLKKRNILPPPLVLLVPRQYQSFARLSSIFSFITFEPSQVAFPVPLTYKVSHDYFTYCDVKKKVSLV